MDGRRFLNTRRNFLRLVGLAPLVGVAAIASQKLQPLAQKVPDVLRRPFSAHINIPTGVAAPERLQAYLYGFEDKAGRYINNIQVSINDGAKRMVEYITNRPPHYWWQELNPRNYTITLSEAIKLPTQGKPAMRLVGSKVELLANGVRYWTGTLG